MGGATYLEMRVGRCYVVGQVSVRYFVSVGHFVLAVSEYLLGGQVHLLLPSDRSPLSPAPRHWASMNLPKMLPGPRRIVSTFVEGYRIKRGFLRGGKISCCLVFEHLLRARDASPEHLLRARDRVTVRWSYLKVTRMF